MGVPVNAFLEIIKVKQKIEPKALKIYNSKKEVHHVSLQFQHSNTP
jgi:hypothetical protein